MNPAKQTILTPSELVRLLLVHRRLWLVPAAAVSLLALAYALWRPATWEASQALIVRNEAVNNEVGPGKFGHTDERKTVQETILELARSRGVLAAALERVGPAADCGQKAAWPTARDIVKTRKRVRLVPPNGAEFGKTEVFYLKVRDRDRCRAVLLAGAICEVLQERFQQLRDAKACSMVDELVKTVQLAKADLEESTARLAAVEKQVGSDLAELRALGENSSADSSLRRTVTEIRNELRQTRAVVKANRQLLAQLSCAREDPGRLVAMPNRLLESQPALRRLKDGLVDSQLRTAALQGTRSGTHPLVRSAKHSEEEIGRHLHNELAIAVGGLRVELQMNADREAMLAGQLAEATRRLGHLAELRATYANQVAETESRAHLVEQAEQNLAEARAALAGAKASSLISRIDSPDAGIYPIGLSRKAIVLMGIVGGLLTGFGVLFLVAPPVPSGVDRDAFAEYPSPAIPATAATPAATNGAHTTAVAAAGGMSVKQALQKIACGRAPQNGS